MISTLPAPAPKIHSASPRRSPIRSGETNRLRNDSEQRLRVALQQALRRSPYRPLHLISCDVRDGVAILHGVVSSFYLKQLAQCITSSVDGIVGVDNQLEVVKDDRDSSERVEIAAVIQID